MSALPPIADVNGQGAGGPLLTQLGHSRGFESNGCLRPETVIHWKHTQGPFPVRKAVIRSNCCGAEQSFRRLRRLCDLKAEAVGRCGFRRLMTRRRHGSFSVVESTILRMGVIICRRRSANFGMLANHILVLCEIDTESLVRRHKAFDPLHIWIELRQCFEKWS